MVGDGSCFTSLYMAPQMLAFAALLVIVKRMRQILRWNSQRIEQWGGRIEEVRGPPPIRRKRSVDENDTIAVGAEKGTTMTWMMRIVGLEGRRGRRRGLRVRRARNEMGGPG